MDKKLKLRGTRQEKVQAPTVSDTVTLDEFMKINNELVAAQRELHLTNAQLQRQRARFLNIVQDNPDLIFVLDSRGSLVFANATAHVFMGVDQVASLNPDFLANVDKEIQLRDSAGAQQILSVKEIETTWDERPAILFVLRVITERKQLEKLREDVERILRHDLKTPLSGIINLPQILLDEGDLSPDQVETIEHIRDSGYRMLRLINEYMHLFQIDNGSYELSMVSVDLLPLLQTVLSDLSYLREKKNIPVDVFLSGNLATQRDSFNVSGDMTLFLSIMSNLVKNALEASPPGERITIDFDHNDVCSMRISNVGEIPPGFHDRFFEKYTTYGKTGGTGLGTYSARHMARAMGGELELDVSKPGIIAVIARWSCGEKPGV
jgi:signal transduction histidine kinase